MRQRELRRLDYSFNLPDLKAHLTLVDMHINAAETSFDSTARSESGQFLQSVAVQVDEITAKRMRIEEEVESLKRDMAKAKRHDEEDMVLRELLLLNIEAELALAGE